MDSRPLPLDILLLPPASDGWSIPAAERSLADAVESHGYCTL
jgi:hypothetical protein